MIKHYTSPHKECAHLIKWLSKLGAGNLYADECQASAGSTPNTPLALDLCQPVVLQGSLTYPSLHLEPTQHILHLLHLERAAINKYVCAEKGLHSLVPRLSGYETVQIRVEGQRSNKLLCVSLSRWRAERFLTACWLASACWWCGIGHTLRR